MAITRRTFLRTSAVTALGLPFVNIGSALASGRGSGSDRIVVIVNLFGGNDFLNTVVPLSQIDRYRAARPSLHIRPERALALPDRDDLALNPGMTAIRDLYAAGKVAIVVGTGMPADAQGLFDHEASQLNLQSGRTTGSSSTSAPSGWLGRWLDTVDAAAMPAGVDVGGYATLVLAGEQTEALTLFSIESFGIMPGFDSEARLAAYRRIQSQSTIDRFPAALGRERRLQVLDLAGALRERTAGYEPAVEYPDGNALGDALRQCASLIAGDLGVRALTVGADGFDTHAAQNDGATGTVLGNHDYLLMTVSEAIGAFQADLAAHGHGGRVVTLVFSEFGRRVYENIDLGTDHGMSGGMFVVGETVRGGVYGDYPSLADSALVFDGNTAVTVDFRSVYATVLAGHLGADPRPVLGGDFPTLGIFG